MDLYMIRRRGGWTTGEELEGAGKRSARVPHPDFPQDVAWIRSYVVSEKDGQLGTVCIYQASTEDAVRQHADRVGMPADEVLSVVDTVIVRPDPQPAATA